MSDIDTGDQVVHKESGETWVVARVDGGRLTWFGYPAGWLPLSDFELRRKASVEERNRDLAELAGSSHHCAEWAKERLAKATVGEGRALGAGQPAVATPSAPAAPAMAGSSEHYDEVRATLNGLHTLCENISGMERRVGPLGSHARGYTHKITAALRHLDALASPTTHAAPQPAAPQDMPVTWEAFHKAVDEYIDDYEMLGETEDGRDACYTPNENDRALLLDAFMGFDFTPWIGLATQPQEAAPVAQGDALSQAARDVLAERQRQISVEGWTPKHDDAHNDGSLARAAAAYAAQSLAAEDAELECGPPSWWPWEQSWWKPTSRRRMLEKAGALILAELERLDRAAIAQAKESGS